MLSTDIPDEAKLLVVGNLGRGCIPHATFDAQTMDVVVLLDNLSTQKANCLTTLLGEKGSSRVHEWHELKKLKKPLHKLVFLTGLPQLRIETGRTRGSLPKSKAGCGKLGPSTLTRPGVLQKPTLSCTWTRSMTPLPLTGTWSAMLVALPEPSKS